MSNFLGNFVVQKLVIYCDTMFIYTMAYSYSGDLIYVFHDSKSTQRSAIFLVRMNKFVKQNRLGFIEYCYFEQKELLKGVINLPKSFLNVQSGSMLPCQMVWSGDGYSKNAKFNLDIKFPGKYVIVLNNSSEHYFSKKLLKTETLINLATQYVNHGIIFRSIINKLDNLDLVKLEIEYLIKCKKNINQKLHNLAKPTQLTYGEATYMEFLRNVDFGDNLIIEVNDNSIFHQLEPYVNLWQINQLSFLPDLKIDLSKIIFDQFQPITLTTDSFNIIIHRLSGMNLIDINSMDVALSFYKINYLAIFSVVKLIKLYDLTGIILIDLIKNMTNIEMQSITSKITELLQDDWRHSSILGFSRAGIFEITRNK